MSKQRQDRPNPLPRERSIEKGQSGEAFSWMPDFQFTPTPPPPPKPATPGEKKSK
jgi:hypothetical protein